MSDDRPSIEEQYAVAIGSGGGFERIVLAAGLQREAVGVRLLRLRAEYDQVRGAMEQSGEIAPRAAHRVKDLRDKVDSLTAAAYKTPLRADLIMAHVQEMTDEIAGIQRRAPADIMNARAVILVTLASLGDARQMMGALALRMAAKPSRSLAPKAALQLAGRVLDVWLDEICHKCDGTGVIGNRYMGDTEHQCRTCKGTGHRRDILGDSRQENAFATDLMAEVQRQVAAATAGIKAALYQDDDAKTIHPELARRLAELRGPEAAVD